MKQEVAVLEATSDKYVHVLVSCLTKCALIVVLKGVWHPLCTPGTPYHVFCCLSFPAIPFLFDITPLSITSLIPQVLGSWKSLSFISLQFSYPVRSGNIQGLLHSLCDELRYYIAHAILLFFGQVLALKKYQLPI